MPHVIYEEMRLYATTVVIYAPIEPVVKHNSQLQSEPIAEADMSTEPEREE